ncbi:MAG: DUF4328 domain-containing protein [Acidimicrobiia bacterium]|nr:DUF4328 domain-containing protein [Acidimicrobiia bacterium]
MAPAQDPGPTGSMGRVLTVFLAVAGCIELISAATSGVTLVRQQTRIAQLASGRFSFTTGWELGVGLALGLAYLATGIIWMIWQHRAHRNVGLWINPRFRASAIWWWIVPVANLFMPLRAVREIAVTVGRERPRWLSWWWGVLLTGNFLGAATSGIDYSRNLVAFETVSLASSLSITAAAALGIALVGSIDRGLAERRRASGLVAGELPLRPPPILAWAGATAIVTIAGAGLFGYAMPLAMTQLDQSVTVEATEVGQCFIESEEGFPPVDCDQAHLGEVYVVLEYPDQIVYPGERALTEWADPFCHQQFEQYTGVPYADSPLDYDLLFPEADGWLLGDRELVCFVYDPGGDLTAPVGHSTEA